MSYITDVIGSQFTDWEFFDCGDPRITHKLGREAALADEGFQKLHGAFPEESETDLVGVVTVRAGQLKATPADVARLARRTGVTIPTLHIEVMAVRQDWQRQGVGQVLIDTVFDLAVQFRWEIGLYTISLEATPASVPFYTRLGFEASNEIYPDGTRAMWLII